MNVLLDMDIFRQLFRLWRLKLKLRAYQGRYYTLSRNNEAKIIQDYMYVLTDARTTYLSLIARVNKLFPWKQAFLPTGDAVRAHLGCGGNYIDGWYNFDIDLSSNADVRANLAQGIPLRTASVDFIHTEDFLEHIGLEEGKRFLADCFRILKSGGVMRLLTPDLKSIIKKVYLKKSKRHLHWCNAHLGTEGPCEALNMHMRMDGSHRFLYDYDLLSDILQNLGFQVKRVSYNVSVYPMLRFIDLRNFGLNLFLECHKR